ncbi:MAG TPA: flagellar assembly protein FliH [Gammaproteobacteria bacterium]|nr:flagellar assembly protein FliH [Gammaproteobacteria bacterium]
MSDPRARVIRAGQVADCQAWHVPEVGQGAGEGDGCQPLTARQLEQIQEEARREGYEQGLAQGREAGVGEFVDRVMRLETLVQALDRPFEELDEAVERQLAELAMIVARQIVRRELHTEPEQVVGVVREALSALPLNARNVRLCLHPEDVILVREALSLHGSDTEIRLVEDPVLSRGGCRVVTDSSQIDASVEARLNAIIAHTLGGMRHDDEPPATEDGPGGDECDAPS